MPMAIEDCHGCAACCTKTPCPPFSGQAELDTIPPELAAEILAYWNEQGSESPPPGPCFWLNRAGDNCSHWEHRPQVCREFQPDSPMCFWFKGGCHGDPPM